MIRPDLLRAVFDALKYQQQWGLSQDDFIVHEFEKGGQPHLGIDYRYDETLFFRFRIPTERTRTRADSSEAHRFYVTARPGCEAVEESFSATGRDELVSELKDWFGRLYQDVVSVPVVRQFQEHDRAIHELTARLDVLPDEPISRTDVEVFREGLEKLKAEIVTKLEKESADKNILKARVDDLSRDIDFLKQTLKSMTKQKWGELLFSRSTRWQNLYPLVQIASVAMKLLGSGEAGDVPESIPQVIDSISNAADD